MRNPIRSYEDYEKSLSSHPIPKLDSTFTTNVMQIMTKKSAPLKTKVRYSVPLLTVFCSILLFGGVAAAKTDLLTNLLQMLNAKGELVYQFGNEQNSDEPGKKATKDLETYSANTGVKAEIDDLVKTLPADKVFALYKAADTAAPVFQIAEHTIISQEDQLVRALQAGQFTTSVPQLSAESYTFVQAELNHDYVYPAQIESKLKELASESQNHMGMLELKTLPNLDYINLTYKSGNTIFKVSIDKILHNKKIIIDPSDILGKFKSGPDEVLFIQTVKGHAITWTDEAANGKYTYRIYSESTPDISKSELLAMKESIR